MEAFGSNKPPATKTNGCIKLFFEALNDLTIIILIFAAIVSIIINLIVEEHKYLAWIEGFAILCAVGLSAGVQAIQDAQKEKQFADLNRIAEASKHAYAIRDGNRVEIHPSFLVVGDIVEVRGGDEIPGDALLLKGNSVMCDEAAMTGESDVLHKDIFSGCIDRRNKLKSEGKFNSSDKHAFPSPLLLSGTNIKNGTGYMVIISVGEASSIGKIRATLADKEEEKTPLQLKLAKIANDIGYFGLFAGIITYMIMITLAVYDMIKEDEFLARRHVDILVNGFLIAVTVLVVAVPEGLPLAVTLSLAFSVKKMLQDENLVRKFHACETMGSATYICSDKTGTLTLNQMYMIKFWNVEVRDTYREIEITNS